MANCNCNNRYRKSALEICSNTAVTVDPTVTGGVPAPFTLTATDTGCSIEGQTGGARILSSGLYAISFDTVVTSAAAGTVTVQLYRDGVPLPCALSRITLAAAGTGNMSFSTVLDFSTCCNVKPVLTAVFTSTDITALTIDHTSLNIVKQA